MSFYLFLVLLVNDNRRFISIHLQQIPNSQLIKSNFSGLWIIQMSNFKFKINASIRKSYNYLQKVCVSAISTYLINERFGAFQLINGENFPALHYASKKPNFTVMSLGTFEGLYKCSAKILNAKPTFNQ